MTNVYHVLMTVFIHLQLFLPTNALAKVNIYILNQDMCNMFIEGCISLIIEQRYQIREILISWRCGRKTEDTISQKIKLMEMLLVVPNCLILKNWNISYVLYSSTIEKAWIDTIFLQGSRHKRLGICPQVSYSKCKDGSQKSYIKASRLSSCCSCTEHHLSRC